MIRPSTLYDIRPEFDYDRTRRSIEPVPANYFIVYPQRREIVALLAAPNRAAFVAEEQVSSSRVLDFNPVGGYGGQLAHENASHGWLCRLSDRKPAEEQRKNKDPHRMPSLNLPDAQVAVASA